MRDTICRGCPVCTPLQEINKPDNNHHDIVPHYVSQKWAQGTGNAEALHSLLGSFSMHSGPPLVNVPKDVKVLGLRV
jgi:hypothetical protein